MRKFIHVHASPSPYLFEKRSHYDATVIKPDRNQLVYIAKMGITTFTGVSGGLVVRASDSEVGGLILTRFAMNIVFFSRTYYSQKVLVILRKRLFRLDMTKTGTLNNNKTKTTAHTA